MKKETNINILTEFHLGMFEYGNLPDTLIPRYFEGYLQGFGPEGKENNDGMCAFFRIPEGKGMQGFPAGSLIATTCSLGTDLNPYGEGSEVIAVTRNGWEFRANRYSDDIVVGFNNLSETICSDIKEDADILSEIDLSLRFLVFWTRLAPVVRAADETEKQQIITAFKNMKEGIPVTITSKKILQELGLSDAFTIEDLTRPDFADKIQHTARLREDILRWHYTRYGQTVQGDTKLAQQSVDEVNGTISSSLIIPLNMLKARQQFVDEINRKFGTAITVQLSGPWRAEITKYENETGEGEIDDTDNTPDQDETPEPENDEPKEGGEDNVTD